MTVAVKVVVAPHPAQGRFETGPYERYLVGGCEWMSVCGMGGSDSSAALGKTFGGRGCIFFDQAPSGTEVQAGPVSKVSRGPVSRREFVETCQ